MKLTKVFRTSFLENPEFAARVSEISNYALRSDLMNGSYDIEIRSIAVDCMNEGKLTTFDIRKKIVEVIGAMYPEPKYEEGNKDFVRYEVKVGNFSPYSYSREESVFVNPYLDNRLVDEAMYAAVMTVIRKE